MAGRFPALTRLLAVLALCGCASQGVLTWEPESEAERELRERAERLQATVGEASLSGALLGALLVAATGNPGAIAAGARAGQAVGAAAGLYVRNLQRDYAEREALLRRIIEDLTVSLREVEEALDAMRRVLEEQRAAIASLEAAVARGEARRDALERQRRKAEAQLEEMQRAIAGAERREEVFAETRGLVLAETGPAAGAPALEQDLDLTFRALADRISSMRRVAETLAEEI